MSPLTRREIEIVRRFKEGESIRDLTERYARPVNACSSGFPMSSWNCPAFTRDEVDAALRKAVQNVPADLWAEWTGAKSR